MTLHPDSMKLVVPTHVYESILGGLEWKHNATVVVSILADSQSPTIKLYFSIILCSLSFV